MSNPYSGLPENAFWKSAVTNTSPLAPVDLYTRKWPIKSRWSIATAGSCFAQHVAARMAKSGYNVIDVEPAPESLPAKVQKDYGYSMYSARFGNLYTVRQLLQLAQEAFNEREPGTIAWKKGNAFIDALRPAVEPDGLPSEADVMTHRAYHVAQVRKMLLEMNVFIFTMGLTEAWVDVESGTVFPSASGVYGDAVTEENIQFKNFTYPEIYSDFEVFRALVHQKQVEAGKKELCKFLLTVSPVPLTATKADKHVLQASTYSKSTLRAVAGDLAQAFDDIDYFPSYEIISSSWSRGIFYDSNLRTVNLAGVDVVMKTFFSQHKYRGDAKKKLEPDTDSESQDEAQCEEAILESFAK